VNFNPTQHQFQNRFGRTKPDALNVATKQRRKRIRGQHAQRGQSANRITHHLAPGLLDASSERGIFQAPPDRALAAMGLRRRGSRRAAGGQGDHQTLVNVLLCHTRVRDWPALFSFTLGKQRVELSFQGRQPLLTAGDTPPEILSFGILVILLGHDNTAFAVMLGLGGVVLLLERCGLGMGSLSTQVAIYFFGRNAVTTASFVVR
jgi:hypothetical protein